MACRSPWPLPSLSPSIHPLPNRHIRTWLQYIHFHPVVQYTKSQTISVPYFRRNVTLFSCLLYEAEAKRMGMKDVSCAAIKLVLVLALPKAVQFIFLSSLFHICSAVHSARTGLGGFFSVARRPWGGPCFFFLFVPVLYRSVTFLLTSLLRGVNSWAEFPWVIRMG